jgi:hypothetical protein
MLRPKEFLAANHPVPVDPPRIRYEVVTERVRVGETPPVADAGPPQVNVPAGTITLNGSGSYSPQGSPLTYVWTQEAGPPVTLSAPTSAITTFTAVAGTYYAFRLTVRDPYGGQGIAQTYVSTSAATTVQIVFFNANPSAIAPGQSSTLSWQVVNATSVTLSGVGTVQPVSSMAVSPTVTTTYTLTASNATGSTSANAVVVVNTPAVQLLNCYAVPTNITQGQAATLNWNSTNATSVSITPSIGSVPLSGNIAVTPTSTTTYTITATGANSTSTTCSVAVTVTTGGGLPQIIQFSATPPSINSGQSATLQWIVQNATTVSISGGIGSVALTGSQTVSPTSTTTYTITATNSQGSVTATASVTVNVIPAPSITGFTASPNPSPASGTLVTLTCSATNAVSLNIGGALFNGGSGTYPVFPTTTTTYTCTATGQNGQTASQSVTVTVNGPAGPPYQ